MGRKLEDIQNSSYAIFGKDNVDVSMDESVYIITVCDIILLSQLEELSKSLGVSLLLRGRSSRTDGESCKSKIDIVVPVQ